MRGSSSHPTRQQPSEVEYRGLAAQVSFRNSREIALFVESAKSGDGAGSRRPAITDKLCYENAFFRLKTILGDRMRARDKEAQRVEATIACNILNRMTELGRPKSYAVGR